MRPSVARGWQGLKTVEAAEPLRSALARFREAAPGLRISSLSLAGDEMYGRGVKDLDVAIDLFPGLMILGSVHPASAFVPRMRQAIGGPG